MRRQFLRRLGAALMASVLILQSFGNLSAVEAAEEIQVRTQSQTQMSSEKEVVYVNTYSDPTKREQSFNSNWKFYLGDASGAESAAFDDSRWETVSLPHDYSIEQEYSKSMEAESGYLPGGTGWYRKHFVVSEDMRGKELRIDFDGVYMNATVWVNGTQLGTHPYGYTPFSFDITDYVTYGKENVVTVKVDHQTPSSRWYSGSGIYRNVNLTVTDPVHVDLYGTQISTPNLETEKGSTVHMTVKTTVANAGAEAAEVVLTHTVYEKGTETSIGSVTTTATSVAAGAAEQITADVPAVNPKLWSTEAPNLYTVRTEVKVGENVVDTYDTEYGFRYIEFDTNTGFYLNGQAVKLKGVCMHHDQGALGAEAHYRAIERQVEILQEMGCNSIRVTHNPASEDLIKICNEKGILVIEEFFDGWMYAKNGNSNDYSVWFRRAIEDGNQILGAKANETWAEFDMKATIGRGENAPSIIMWSLGNEIQEGAGGSGYNTMAESLISWAQETGTTKLLTIGSNAVKNGASEHIDIANQLTAVGGVSGTNYSNGSSYDSLHSTYPDWCLYGSETASSVNSRGVYYKTNGSTSNQDLTSYDESAVNWGSLASSAWYDVITRDFVAGEYVWTGFDYIGEPTHWNGTAPGAQGTWPSPKNSFFGIVDTAGFPKDSYYFYQSQWNDDVNTLHILPAWNEDVVVSAATVPVVVYSDAAAVELFFKAAGSNTETSLGKKAFTEKTTGTGYTYQVYEGEDKSSTAHKNLYLTWNVAYEDGTIRAVAYDDAGNVISDTVGRSEVTTTGAAAALNVTADRTEITADGKDLAYVTVDVTDAEGNIVPNASNRVKITVEGNGVLVGVDNGNQTDHDSYQASSRKAYNGKMLAIVQSTTETGTFKVTAKADGLTADSVTVTTTASGDGTGTGEKQVNSFYMSKNYYVKTGNMPELPQTIEARYTDGTTADLAVVWDAIDETAVQSTGTFTVNGVAGELYSVSVTVNMIDEVGGLLNYSTTTPVGVSPVLPEARPAVLADGTILNVSFPVAWDQIPESAYASENTFTVNGIADVFGQSIAVTASVRVQNETVTIGNSVSAAAHLSQDIEENLQSDTLEAIKDGSTAIGANNDGGPNETAWTNYDNSQAGDNTAEITFRYDTQQRIGEIVIHFFKDSWSARYPDAGTTEIYISEDGTDGSWVKVAATEELGTESSNVKPYTYSFAPVTATFIKFCFTNKDENLGNRMTCTGITEIELKEAKGSFVTYDTAELGSMEVNGTALTAEELASGIYYVAENAAEVTAAGADNAAVTILPAYNDEILVIIESEDHLTRNQFVIHLNEEPPKDPEDSSRDYPVDQLTAISESQYSGSGNEGPDDYILDGNANTHWHTNWRTTEATSVDKRWVGVSLDEAASIDGIRYLPRTSGGTNGFVTAYEIQYRAADDGEWIKVAEGTWDRTDTSWKLVTFDAVTAKQVRIVGVHTYADSGNDAHMSAAEFRVTQKQEKPPVPVEKELSGISVKTVPKTAYTAGESFDPAGLELNLIYSNGEVGTAAYSAENASEFGFSLTAALTADHTSVTITYGEKETTLGITVTEPLEDNPPLTADDDSRDCAVGDMTMTAGTQQGDCIGNATDGNTATFWETNWSQGTAPEDLWIQVELTEATELEALRYYPRYGTGDGDQNGFVSKYRVDVKTDEAAEWLTVSEGDWTISDEWLIAQFNEPVTAKYIRLTGVETLTNGNAQTTDMSAAEIRVRKAAEVTGEATFTGISVKAAPNTVYTVGDSFDPTGLVLNLTYSDNTTRELAYAEDAGITIEPTEFTAAGNQIVTVKYTEDGVEAATTLDVYVQEAVTLTGISVETAPSNTTYTEGDVFNPEGLVLLLTYSNGTTETVAYSGNESAFAFEPALDAALTTDIASVKISYAGLETTQEITVNEPVSLTGISVKTAPAKVTYKEGESLDPTGLVLTLTYSDGSKGEAAYSDQADKFTLDPAAGTSLNTENTKVTVTYEGKTTEFSITVNDEQTPVDPVDPVTPDEVYEIYPTPQNMSYLDGAWIMRTQANVVYEEGIDDATKARLEEALDQKGITVKEASEISDGMTNILVGIYGSGGYADTYVQDNLEFSEDLFSKTDAYILSSKGNTIAVLGKDTDAAFYGLTSLYHILGQMESRTIRNFMMEDWADVVSRGFIEGYYGNPWSLEDRCELMKWGGYYKLNSYFYAPKDDPKHNSQWRELYTDEEIETLIKPLAEAGNNSKCRFVFALHPYMYNAIGSGTGGYDGDLAILQAKFEQVIKAGVRQIAILADDAGNAGSANYIKLLEDMTEWLQEMRKTYPDLKLTLPFCPVEYMYNGESYYANFPENVQVVMTGGRVWGEVSDSFTTSFKNNTGRAPYMWVNWPCSDNSKQHLIMGGYTTFLHAGLDASKIQGIVLNPMQQSEPSKVAIFGNAAYSWNIWETEDEAEQAWEASFKYVDHNSAEETKASSALRELSLHMMNQNMDSRVTALQESVAIRETLDAFKTGLTAGTVTKEDCDEIIAIFDKLQKAAATYSQSGNERIKDQISYWLDCWDDTTNAAIALLEAVKAEIGGDSNTLLAKYNEGKAAFAQSKTYGFHYVDHTEYAEVGVQHIVPFITALQTYAAGRAELVLNPNAMLTTYITNRTDVPAVGSVDDILDGNESTGAIYKTPNAIREGDYVGLIFSKVIDITDVKFVLGAGKDHFDHGKVQYTLDGKTWTDLNDTVYDGVTGQVQKVELKEAQLGADFKAMGIRFVATADNANDAWLEVREIAVNKASQGGEDPSDTSIYSNVIKTDRWTIYSGSESLLYDGNDNSYVWYDPNGGSGDVAEVGDYIGYNFGKVLKLQSIHAVVGNDGADKFVSYEIQTSTDGTTWETVKTCSGVNSGKDVVDVELNGKAAQYVRIVNTAERPNWIKISELTVEQVRTADDSYVYTNIETDVLSQMSENKVALTGGTVTLGNGDYIGMKLTNIKEVQSIDVTELADGLVLQTSMNAEEWTDYQGGETDARYIRVLNKNDADVTWTFETFETTYYTVGEFKVEDSNFPIEDTSRDMRSAGNVANVFDGDLSTIGEITGVQTAGNYVIFDLGRTVDFETIRYYIAEGHLDYPRSLVLEVADSPDAEQWSEVLSFEKEGFTNEWDDTTAKSMQDKGLTHDSKNPGYMYAENTGLNVSGRYLRARIPSTYAHRWLAFNEIQINGGEYVSVEPNKDIISDTTEVPYQIPSNALDQDFATSYVPSAQNGSFTYRLSEPQDVQSIRLIQVGEASNAKVTAVFSDGTTKVMGSLCQSINEFNVPDGVMLYSVKVEWTDKIPEIAEIMTFTTKEDASSVLDQIRDALDSAADTDNWTDKTRQAYDTARANAEAALENPYISKASVESILAALNSAIANGVVRYTSNELAAEVAAAVTNEDGTYTSGSYRTYADVLAEAKNALKDAGNLSATDGEALYEALKEAKEALVYSKLNRETAQLLVSDMSKYSEEGNYTEDSWKALQDAKKALEELLTADKDASRVHPDEYTDPIQAAEEALNNIVDITELKAALEEYESANKDAYTKKSWSAYEKAAKEAGKLLKGGTKEQVEEALTALREAKEALAVKAGALPELLEEAKAYKAEDYTSKSYEKLQEAIKNAEAEETEEAAKVLEEAIKGLVNIKALKEKVAETEKIDLSNYSKATADALEKAINNAKTLYEAGTTEQVKAALNALKNAQDKLAPVQQGMEEYRNGIKLHDKADYTDESYQAYKDAYNKLMGLSLDCSMEEYLQAKKAFEEAETKLVKKQPSKTDDKGTGSSSQTGQQSPQSGTTQTAKTGQNSKTGDTANLWPLMAVLVIAAAGFGFVQYKKKRDDKDKK